MKNYRVFVEKKEDYVIESVSFLDELVKNLSLTDLSSVRIVNVYDVFDIEKDVFDKAKETVFSNPSTDIVYEEILLENKKYFAVEPLPGQFDQRADASKQCIDLLSKDIKTKVKTGKIYIFNDSISLESIDKIKKYFINSVETREKNLNAPLVFKDDEVATEVPIHSNFINLSSSELEEFRNKQGFAMSEKDMLFVQNYFKNEENRDPSETELKILDTYWSDHCRHTTFETLINSVKIEDGAFSEAINKVFNEYKASREYVYNYDRPMTLMDMATIIGKEQRKKGLLDDLEVSDEVNACSVRVKVDVNGVDEDWLLMFKNETHNHPTEIEPFGGASTCLGGAIRDPLSGRAYVYQAMRITGAADINEKIEDTLPNKLPQQVISRTAAKGYSSYGNQIGVASTYLKEIFHSGYKAKRMEAGAIVSAVKEDWVRREKPIAGDVIILLGGKTGRDGCGGATGSSREQTEDSFTTSSAEVQKGNPPEERKIVRLFRKEEVTKLIKKCNDFGAGGVSVAIGELADGLAIDLDKVPVKYNGLSGTELAISESQERMAVVVAKEDESKFIKLADEENLDAVTVAVVTEERRLIINWRGKHVANISRDFLNTNGVRNETNVVVESIENINPFKREVKGDSIKDKFMNNLKNENIASQKGLVEMFDSTVGATTVLMPFGGKYQLTEIEASIQKIPVENSESNTASLLTYGYEPNISSWSPFHGAMYAVIESISKIVASGSKYQGIRFSFQEFFQRLGNDHKNWGKPFAALLGSIHVQKNFGLPAIGGKDSMSGTFNDINVPPTLISFAVNTENANNIISGEFKKEGNYVYLVKHNIKENYMPNIEELKENYDFIYKNIIDKKIISAYSVKFGGVAEAIAKMSFGNKIGIDLDKKYSDILFDIDYGSIVIESNVELNNKNALLLGKTNNSNEIKIGNEIINIDEAIKAWTSLYESLYPIKVNEDKESIPTRDYKNGITIINKNKVVKPKVFIPIFPGSNTEYDTIKAFVDAGAEVSSKVFKNRTKENIIESINEIEKEIINSNILLVAGGFVFGDEPEGAGKFETNLLLNEQVRTAIDKLINNDGLILGISNGFHALLESGLLLGDIYKTLGVGRPTITRNEIDRHVSKIVNTRVSSNLSPWLNNMEVGTVHSLPVSFGFGKFVANEKLIDELFKNGQIATQYVDNNNNPTMNGEYNPSGSLYAIEGITSKDGRVFGKMANSERTGNNLYKNITGNKVQNIFESGVKYFK